MRRFGLFATVLALIVVFGAPPADAGIVPKFSKVKARLESFVESTGTGLIRAKDFVTTQLGLNPGDNPGVAIENNNVVTVTAPPVVVVSGTSQPYAAANGFVSSGPTGTSFADPGTGCGGSLGFSGYLNAGAYNPGAGKNVDLLIPIQVPPGTSKGAVREQLKKMKIGSGVLDAGFNITAELQCSFIAPEEPIPTMSSWGFGALIGLLLLGGSWVVYRRRRAFDAGQPA